MESEDKRKIRKRRPAEQPTRAEAPARPRRRRSKNAPAASYNPGQLRLLMDLLDEFAGKVEVAQVPGGDELAVRLSCDIPHLETFIEYKIRDLVRQQDRLAHLWDLSEAG